MVRITGKMLRARLVQQLAMPSPLHHSDSQADYSSVALLSIPTDDAFVTEAYRRLLLREPDLEGMQHFLTALRAHRQMVVDFLANSPEGSKVAEGVPGSAQTDQGVTEIRPHAIDLTDLDRLEAEDVFVRESYRRILGREADTRGLGHFWTLLLSGVPKVKVLAMLAGSNEARVRDLDFLWKGHDIQSANEQASKPDTSAGEQAPESSQAKEGVPAKTLRVVDLTNLDQFETEEAFLKESYRRILGREADPTGLGYYWSLLLFGVRKVEVLAMLAGSNEAAARNRDFLWHGQNIESAAGQGMSKAGAGIVDVTGVNQLGSGDSFLGQGYRRILGREQGLAGIREHEGVLENGPGFVDLADLDRFETEDAFLRESYRRIMGRDGDAEGLRYHRELLFCNVPKVQVLARLARSPEAKARSIRFLWKGTELPAPVRLGIGTRLRLLYRRSTGRSRFENAICSLSSQLQTVLERDNALREEIHLFSTRTLAAHAELAATCDAIRSETMRAQDQLTSKWRGVAADIEKLSDHVLKTTAAVLAGHASIETKCENIASETMKQQDRWTGKWGEINSNFEKLSNQALRTTAAMLAAHANVENRCDTISSEMMKQHGQWTGKWSEIASKIDNSSNQALRTKAAVLAGHASIETKCDAIASETRKQHGEWTGKWSEITGKIDDLSNHSVRAEAAVAAGHASIET